MFGDRLKQLRELKGLTQEEFGKQFHILRSSVSMYENNIRIPNVDLIKEIASFFNVSIDYLLGNDRARFEDVTIELCCLLKKIGFLKMNDVISSDQIETIIGFLISNKDILLRK